MLPDAVLDILGQALDEPAPQVLVTVEARERPLLLRQLHALTIRGVADDAVDAVDRLQRLLTAVRHAHLDQGVGQAHRAQAGAARALTLHLDVQLGEVGRGVDHVVEEADGVRGITRQVILQQLPIVVHVARQVQRTQVAHATRR